MLKRKDNKTLNFAHRGFTREFPDNTLESFQAAIILETDGMECDIHETRDHNFVVHHDADIDGMNIRELSLNEVLKHKVGEKYQMPILPDVLRLCKGKSILFIEVKQIASPKKFLDMVKNVMNPEDVFLGSFNTEILQQLERFAPEYHKGLITAFLPPKPLEVMAKNRCSILVNRIAETNIDLVESIHHDGKSILVWDCNSTADIRTALSIKVDGIVSDYPDIVKQEIEKYYENR